MRLPHSAFLYWPELCARLIDRDTRQGALSIATAPGLVVFDDFGAEYLKDGGLLAATIDSLVWRRHADILPTLITTNLTPDQLRERLSDRIIDRLRDDWASIHVIAHDSLRAHSPNPFSATPSQTCY
jgi:DNA replication protein DnaC